MSEAVPKRHVDVPTYLAMERAAEVLSDSTEGFDRGEKFIGYRSIPSLSDYLLVSQHAPRVEHYARQDDGSWVLRTYGPGARVVLPSLGIELPVDELFDGVLPIEAQTGASGG